MVDLDARLIERWRPDHTRPKIIPDAIEWQPENATTPFEMYLAEYFGEVLDE